MRLGLTTLILGAFSTVAIAGDHGKAKHSLPTHGVVVLSAMKDSKVGGVLTLKQEKGYVHVSGKVWNLEPGDHGFHIHEFGDLRDAEGKSAGGHYNPEGKKHGGPHDDERHSGDLGNITAGKDGVSHVNIKAKGLNLHMVLGRSIVVHAKADDLKSQPSGDAGPRIGVGVIGLAQVKQ